MARFKGVVRERVDTLEKFIIGLFEGEEGREFFDTLSSAELEVMASVYAAQGFNHAAEAAQRRVIRPRVAQEEGA